MQTVLFIDGRNFISKLSIANKLGGGGRPDFSIYNFKGLFDKVLAGIKIDRKIFYLGRLVRHSETIEKSEQLIQEQRRLKTHLEGQGFEVVITGRVRGHIERCALGHETLPSKRRGLMLRLQLI